MAEQREQAVAGPSTGQAGTLQRVLAGQSTAEVPERPSLAANIELKGEMTESAFVEAPWLIERQGSYLQVTEYVHRIVEQIDGQRTVPEIAEAASRALQRAINPEDVKHLIVTNLIPAGIVSKSDGTIAETAKASPSPLAVNMRMALVSPRIVEPLTALLGVFYWPPVLVTLLALAAVGHWWLYFVHGVGESMRAAFYTPGGLLGVLALVVLSAGFHELGHAAALRYGGGRVRSMGAGFYLSYPAFYTDVTDNYRLPRWSRVRTDLGGFYFNLLFALGLMGLYFLTGQEFLLLTVLLVNIGIIHQLLPFVRLDGYWALADITGIPDFFSLIGPYLRSVLPDWIPFPKGRELPKLKTWARWFFAFYISITVPLLAFLLFLTIKAVPRILATAWDAFWQQTNVFSEALSAANFLLLAATVVQMVTLLLPPFGVLFLLYNLGKRAGTAVWNWSKPTPLRRAVGAFGTAAFAGFVAFLWLPQVPVIDRPGPFYSATSFKPISEEERFTIPEVVRAGRVAAATTPPSRETPAPTMTSAPAPDQGAGVAPAPAATTSAPVPTSTVSPVSAPAPITAPLQPVLIPTVVPPLPDPPPLHHVPQPEPPEPSLPPLSEAITPLTTPLEPIPTVVPPLFDLPQPEISAPLPEPVSPSSTPLEPIPNPIVVPTIVPPPLPDPVPTVLPAPDPSTTPLEPIPTPTVVPTIVPPPLPDTVPTVLPAPDPSTTPLEPIPTPTVVPTIVPPPLPEPVPTVLPTPDPSTTPLEPIPTPTVVPTIVPSSLPEPVPTVLPTPDLPPVLVTPQPDSLPPLPQAPLL